MKKRVKIKDLVLSGLIGFLIGYGAFSINQNETKSTDNTIEVQATQQTQEETIEEKTTITIDVKKAFSNIESIIDNDAPFKDLVSEINKLELATEKSIETLATETENNIVCQKIIKKLYEENGYQEELSKTFKKESFSVKNESKSKLINLSLPTQFIQHGTIDELLEYLKLDLNSLKTTIKLLK